MIHLNYFPVRESELAPTVLSGHLWVPRSEATQQSRVLFRVLLEDYQNKMDTISLLVSLTCLPALPWDDQRLCKMSLTAGQVWPRCDGQYGHHFALALVSVKWLIIISPRAPHDRGAAEKIRFWMERPRQNSITQHFVKSGIWGPGCQLFIVICSSYRTRYMKSSRFHS